MIDYKEKLNTLFTDEKLDAEVEKKLSEYSRLITRETALFLIAKENNMVFEASADSSSLKSQKSRFSITGTIARIFPVREYGGNGNSTGTKAEGQKSMDTSRGQPQGPEPKAAGTKPKTQNQRLWLHDEKGDFTLVLWNVDTNLTKGKIGLGDKIKIIGATYRDGEANLGYGGKIEKIGGIPTTPLSGLPSLTSETCNVEGEISEIYPEFYYKRASGEEAVMRSFDLTEENTTVNVSVWHEPEQLNDFKFKDKVRLENAKYKKSSLQLNSNSRLVLLERKEEDGAIRGVLEHIEAQGQGAKANISGKEHSISQVQAMAILNVSSLPPDVPLSTLIEIKKGEILGKEIAIRTH